MCHTRIWICHLIYEWVLSHTSRVRGEFHFRRIVCGNESRDMWMSHVTRMQKSCLIFWHMDESRHAYRLVAPHTWMSRHAVVSHTWMNVTNRHESQRVWCQKYSLWGWVTSHLTYEWVISRIRTCRVYVTWLIHDSFMTHLWLVCTLQHTATHCNTLQHTATHGNTLQHTAIHNSFMTPSWLVYSRDVTPSWLTRQPVRMSHVKSIV